MAVVVVVGVVVVVAVVVGVVVVVVVVVAVAVVVAVGRLAMNLIYFARMVVNMRVAQKEYFRHRDGTSLDLAKHLEKQVDEAIKDILNPRPLFKGQP